MNTINTNQSRIQVGDLVMEQAVRIVIEKVSAKVRDRVWNQIWGQPWRRVIDYLTT
jgi:hypothetical protein